MNNSSTAPTAPLSVRAGSRASADLGSDAIGVMVFEICATDGSEVVAFAEDDDGEAVTGEGARREDCHVHDVSRGCAGSS